MPRGAISLDPRLAAIAEMCGKCAIFADIGCDHGRLGAYMLQTNKCQRAQFCDISEPSLDKAKRLIQTLSLSKRAIFGVGDGAFALTEPADCVVISGMGGETVCGIIKRGREKLGDARLIIEPNIDAPLVRRALMREGYIIDAERIVKDGCRLYVLISARRGEAQLSDAEIEIGPCLMRDKPDTLFDFAAFRIRVAKKAIAGAERARADCSELKKQLEIWEAVASWQK